MPNNGRKAGRANCTGEGKEDEQGKKYGEGNYKLANFQEKTCLCLEQINTYLRIRKNFGVWWLVDICGL